MACEGRPPFGGQCIHNFEPIERGAEAPLSLVLCSEVSLVAFQAEAAEQQKQVLRSGDPVAVDVGRARVHLRKNAGSIIFGGGRVAVLRAFMGAARYRGCDGSTLSDAEVVDPELLPPISRWSTLPWSTSRPLNPVTMGPKKGR